jgi:hypothetical protein
VDEYDEYSTYILAFQSGELVSGCRLIDGDLTALPVSLFVRKIEGRSFEMSRMVTSRDVLDKVARAQIHLQVYAGVHHFAFGMSTHDYLYSHIRRCYLRRLRDTFGAEFFHEVGPAARNEKNGRYLWLIPVVRSRVDSVPRSISEPLAQAA